MDITEISREVLGAAFRVSNVLGCGFLEKVYENALAIEIRRRGLSAVQQIEFNVQYQGAAVGSYYADLVVADQLIVETKTVRAFDAIHEAQCINYLKASGLRVCLLLNFARPRLQYRRILLGTLAKAYRPRMNTDTHGMKP
jgi:GxxExxY protein